MKRLSGTLGLVYLSVLAAVFYFFSGVTICIILSLSAAIAVCSLIYKAKNNGSKQYLTVFLSSLTAMLAVFAIILYQNYIVSPIVDNYSDKEISITGYICDEPELGEKIITHTIKTYTVNGEEKSVKLKLFTYTDKGLQAFDKIEATMLVEADRVPYDMSRGIFLSSFQNSELKIRSTGEKHFTLYSYAVEFRKQSAITINRLLSRNEAQLVRTMLLGDRAALTRENKNSFSKTGMSYLIVVSGMHLSLIAALIRFVTRRFPHKAAALIADISAILFYIAVTGFFPSVVRAGVMAIIMCAEEVFLRDKDSVNSLGIAAVVLTAANPLAVGDLGMILSFAATLGTATLGDHMHKRILHTRKMINLCNKSFWTGKYGRIRIGLYKLLYGSAVFFSGLLCVSVSAALFTLPVTSVCFGRIVFLTVPLSMIASPLTTIVLYLSVLMLAVSFVPLLSSAVAWLTGMLARLLLSLVNLAASIRFGSMQLDPRLALAWCVFTAIIVTIVLIIRKKRRKSGLQIITAVFVSLIFLLTGSFAAIAGSGNSTALEIIGTANGNTIFVRGSGGLSLLSAGGSGSRYPDIKEQLLNTSYCINTCIIPDKKNKHAVFLNLFQEGFDVRSVLVYDNKKGDCGADFDGCAVIPDGCTRTFWLNEKVKYSAHADGVLSQYLVSGDTTLLYLVSGADAETLPEKWRRADIVILEGVPKNYRLLDCKRAVYIGAPKNFEKAAQRLNTFADSFENLYNDSLTITL